MHVDCVILFLCILLVYILMILLVVTYLKRKVSQVVVENGQKSLLAGKAEKSQKKNQFWNFHQDPARFQTMFKEDQLYGNNNIKS